MKASMETPDKKYQESVAMVVGDGQPQNENMNATSADIDEQISTSNDIPKKPAWGIIANSNTTSTDSTKRSNFADIMSEQQVEKSIEQQSTVTKVSFSQDVESEEERMMRLAIEASLQDQKGISDEVEQQTYASKMPPSILKSSNSNIQQPIDDQDDNDIKMAIALSLQESEGKSEIEENDRRKPSAMLKQEVDDIGIKESKSSTSVAAAASTSGTIDESEILAQAIHQAELDEQLDKSKAEEASLQLAMKLQEEESLDNRLKREEICRGGSAQIGVRTVSRDEFQSLKNSKDYGDDRLTDRRKQEEHGMGKLLSCKSYYGEDTTAVFDNVGQADDTSEYYYYASDRNRGDDVDIDEEDMDNGIRMNSSTSSQWKRLDRDTFIGPNNEVKTKHDPDIKRRANAVQLLGSHGVKTKDVNNNISDSAYNAFKRADKRQTGTKKGVARQGKVAADDLTGGRTKGGGMDGNVRLQITSAVNAGLINKCNGVVKEGKEALVYHAEAGRKPQVNDLTPDDTYVGSDGYDVAVKVFKRVVEFKGRGSYVDGDPRYHKQKFSTNDMRNQVVLWCEKEYRNLIRAHRAGVPVPKPLLQRENILFSRFLGDSGWPSPQLKEVDIRRGSSKWTLFYFQTLVAVRRLYHCARLVHCDLSEYNILICPQWQVSGGQITSPDKRSRDDDTLQVVLIDFASAVDTKHSSAITWLKRDLTIVRAFFEKKGIKTLSNEDAEEFVTAPFDEVNKPIVIDTIDEESEICTGEQETDVVEATAPNSRYNLLGWSDEANMKLLLEKLSTGQLTLE